MQKITLITSLSLLAVGFIGGYLVFSQSEDNRSSSDYASSTSSDEHGFFANPFSIREDEATEQVRIERLENEMQAVRQQLQLIEQALQQQGADHEAPQGAATAIPRTVAGSNRRVASALTRRLYNLDNLIRGGIDPARAEDIVRRKNSVELERLALQDRATREGYLDTQQYYDELEAINADDVSLRDELGDQRYDEYLYNSKQNNRILITSVMLGSVAEQAGILRGDIVLSYDNLQMYNWQELKDATSEGQLGEYVSISINRTGEIFSFSVPRGPLGIELGATRLAP